MDGKDKKRLIAAVAVLSVIASPAVAGALDRCVEFRQDVRMQHTRYFGPAFPWWYGLGQLRQESGCRADARAFDHGMGIAQFMPATAREIARLMAERIDPFNPEQAIRMQAFYMARLHRKSRSGLLCWTYQAYNGGWKTLFQENDRAGGTWSWTAMKAQCRRKKIQMRWGILDLCEVNYDYPVRIYRYGKHYRTGPDGMRYW